MNTKSPTEKFRKVTECWQKHLLDFARRNHQLHFRPEPARGRPTTIRVKDHTPDSIIQALSEKKEGRGLLFDNVEPRAKSILDSDDDLAAGDNQVDKMCRCRCGGLAHHGSTTGEAAKMAAQSIPSSRVSQEASARAM